MANAYTPLDQGFRRRVTFLILVILALAGVFSLLWSLLVFSLSLQPIIEAEIRTITLAAQADIEYALSVGVPLDELRGLDVYLEDLVDRYPALQSMTLAEVSSASDLWSSAEASSPSTDNILTGLRQLPLVLSGGQLDHVVIPIRESGSIVSTLTATPEAQIITRRLRGMIFDSFVVLFVSLLVANEVIVVLARNRIQEPIERLFSALRRRSEADFGSYDGYEKQSAVGRLIASLNVLNHQLWTKAKALVTSGNEVARRKASDLMERTNLGERDGSLQASILDARIPLFIFCFAEELQKSFLPLFVSDVWKESDLFDRSVMVGLPISVFMFVIAVLTPFSGALVERFGTRRMFLAGLFPAIAGYLICAFAGSGNEILFGRGLTAIGYAVITISCQSYIADVASAGNRAQAMAIFVGVLMTATLCGTSIGAILADWLGFQAVFMIAAVLACLAGLTALATLQTLENKTPGKASAKTIGSFQRTMVLFANLRFASLILFCAIPAKILLTGVLYLLVPLYLIELSASQTDIGRVMMLYALVIIPISPLASRLADRLNKNMLFVISSTLASGALLIAMWSGSSIWSIVILVTGLGLIHAFLKAPLIVSVIEASEAKAGVSRTLAMSLLRTSDRIGSVIGPVLIATMLIYFDFTTTVGVTGVLILVCGLAMFGLTMVLRWR